MHDAKSFLSKNIFFAELKNQPVTWLKIRNETSF